MTLKICETCIHCTSKNKESGRGLCTEQHQPSNAKGEHKGLVYLQRIGCRHHVSALESALSGELSKIENDAVQKRAPMELPSFPERDESARSKKKYTHN